MEPTPIYAKIYEDDTMIFSSFDYIAPEHGEVRETFDEEDMYDTEQVPWLSNITSVAHHKADKIIIYDKIAPLKTAYWFYGIGDIKGLENLITNNVTSMEGMFKESRMEEIDLSNFDTSNVTNMRIMFSDSMSIKKLKLNSFNTSKVTNMMSMFTKCPLLQEVDLSSFIFNEDVILKNEYFSESIFSESGIKKVYVRDNEAMLKLKEHVLEYSEEVEILIK